MYSQHQVMKNKEIKNQINEKTNTNRNTHVPRETHKYKNKLPYIIQILSILANLICKINFHPRQAEP